MRNLSVDQHKILNLIYDTFNKEIFNGDLPGIIFTIDARDSKFYGLFHFEKMKTGKFGDESLLSTITMNSDYFNRDPIETMATIVHEMVHCWQFYYGNPSGAYHNREWAAKMEFIGLMPSSTGEPGGKRTGRIVSHYIINGGLFERIASNFIENEKIITLFEGIRYPKKAANKSRNKMKYTCPSCRSNTWGKEGLSIICGDCRTDFIMVEK